MEIEDRLDNLDRRLDRIEQILPILPGKEDRRQALENYLTKADLAEVSALLSTGPDPMDRAVSAIEKVVRQLNKEETIHVS